MSLFADYIRTDQDMVDRIDVEGLKTAYFVHALWAAPKQQPPPGDWMTWLLLGGRGSGKTMAGSMWIRDQVRAGIGPVALVGETITEAISVMVRGESGLMRVTPPEDMPRLRGNELLWPNGVEGMVLGAADPERFRGPQFAAAWCDEVAKWPNAQDAWDMLQFGLRLGAKPRQIATTTPRATKFIRGLIDDPGTVTVRMTTHENKIWLASSFLAAVVARYQNTVLGRQEIDGELVEDDPDALWTRALLDAHRLAGTPEGLGRIVVAVDPAVTSTERSDACGIVVAARLGETAVVLADWTVRGVSPLAWAKRAVAAYKDFEADCIVAEVNQGGDLITEMIAMADEHVPVRPVRARRGKWLRAEPVAALYANGKVKHVAGLTALEDEMCRFGADGKAGGRSPDRVDALVWALTELLLNDGPRPRVRGL